VTFPKDSGFFALISAFDFHPLICAHFVASVGSVPFSQFFFPLMIVNMDGYVCGFRTGASLKQS
jgi:hypothetical protein